MILFNTGAPAASLITHIGDLYAGAQLRRRKRALFVGLSPEDSVVKRALYSLPGREGSAGWVPASFSHSAQHC